MAVRHGYGKIAGTDALVFAYDTGDTRNSYKGEPTTNYTTDTPSQGGWSGTYNVLDSSRKTFRLNVSNFNASPGAGWRSFTWDLNSYSGQSVTISATVDVPASSPGDFAWIMMGQTNTYTNNVNGAGQYLGYSAGSERVQKTTTTRERITWSGTVGSTGTANQPSGHVGFTVWYNNGTPGTNSYVEVSDVQIELKSHETPFVNGTRSNTQGLLDLTGTNTIDLSSVNGYNSNAQLEFDGTNDKIDINIDSWIRTVDNITVEGVVEIPSGASMGGGPWAILTDHSTNSERDGFWWHMRLGGGYTYFRVEDTVYGERGITFSNPSTFSAGNTYHIATVVGNDGVYVYNNGVQVETYSPPFNWADISSSHTASLTIGRTYPGYWLNALIHNLKLYNRALTAAEVKNNYNNYKGRFNI